MTGPLTPREAALKVAAIGALRDRLDKAYRDARAEAEEVFAAARKEGATQQRVLLPDDTDLGLISIRGGSPVIGMPEGTLLAWCNDNLPDGVESYLAEGAAGMTEVIALVAERFPNLVKRRVRPGTELALRKQLAETGGYLVNGDGEKSEVANVSPGTPTGVFAYRAAAGAHDKILAALWDQLREVTANALAIEGGEGE